MRTQQRRKRAQRLRSSSAASNIDGLDVANENLRHSVFRRALRPGMASDADALLAAARPHPALLRRQHLARLIKQFETQGHFRRRVDVERTVRLDRGFSERTRGS